MVIHVAIDVSRPQALAYSVTQEKHACLYKRAHTNHSVLCTNNVVYSCKQQSGPVLDRLALEYKNTTLKSRMHSSDETVFYVYIHTYIHMYIYTLVTTFFSTHMHA
jgi:hypothetical protein